MSISSFKLEPNRLIAVRRWVLAFLGDQRHGLKIDPPSVCLGSFPPFQGVGKNTVLTIFMSVVWTSWKLPISIKFNQKFHTPEDLIRGPRSNLDPTSDLDPTSHLDPTSTPTSTPSRLDLGLPHLPQRATGPLPPPLAPVRSSPTAQSRVPTSPSRRSALRRLGPALS